MANQLTKDQIISFAAGIILSLIALAALLYFIDLEQAALAFANVKFINVIPLALILLFAFIFRSYSWRVILKERISLKRSFFIINAGYLVNTLLPFRMGEIARTFLLLPYGFSFWEALPTIVLERMFDLFFGLSLFFIGLPFALGFDQNLVGVYIFAGALALGIAVLIILFKFRAGVSTWVSGLPILSERIKGRLQRLITSVLSGFEAITDPIKFIRIFLGMAGAWGLSFLFQYYLFLVFFPEAKPIWIVFALGAVAIGISVPSSPGNIGLYEASLTLALLAFGVDQSLAFSYAVTSHILNLLIPISCGPFGLIKGGYKLNDIWRLRDQQKREDFYE